MLTTPSRFHGFWDTPDGRLIDTTQYTQLRLWARALRFFHPHAHITLHTRKRVLPPDTLGVTGVEVAYFDDVRTLFRHTPLYTLSHDLDQLPKPELSDLVRLALLYRFGGTWADVDDLTVRAVPTELRNVLGTFLWPRRPRTATYWGSTFVLADGARIGEAYTDYTFHVQNDPMVRWDAGHPFLCRWMLAVHDVPPCDWGQKLPTDLLRATRATDVTLTPQHHLLLHPAFGHNAQFGHPTTKGPMFPPFDARVPHLPDYDTPIDRSMFETTLDATLAAYPYWCVKHSKNIGFAQCREGGPHRWFVGFLADPSRFEAVLHDLHRREVGRRLRHQKLANGLLLAPVHPPYPMFADPPRTGRIPYTHYNTSILALTPTACARWTLDRYCVRAVLVVWFVAVPGYHYGTMSWVGVVAHASMAKALARPSTEVHSTDWLVRPHLLQNDQGPKCADLRLFTFGPDAAVGAVGYTRVAPTSNTPDIADYYVRAFRLSVRKTHVVTAHPPPPYTFTHVDGGCFPASVGYKYAPFEVGTTEANEDDTLSEARPRIECYVEDALSPRPIVPHASKAAAMPARMVLNGVEVAWSSTDPNDVAATRVSTKNVVPLQHWADAEQPTHRALAGFVDAAPPDGGPPRLSVIDVHTGTVRHTARLDVDAQFRSRGWRGSTPFVELPHGGLWLTLLHRATTHPGMAHARRYEYVAAVYSATTVDVDGQPLTLPHACVHEVALDDGALAPAPEFVYITGLMVDTVHVEGDTMTVDVWLSYGVSDRRSAVCAMSLRLPVGGMWRVASDGALNGHGSGSGGVSAVRALCRVPTRRKRRLAHSSTLSNADKVDVEVGTEVRVVGEEGDHYVVEEGGDRWYVYKEHFLGVGV